MTKRLHNRKRRKFEECKQRTKSRSTKCNCSKCTGFRYVQKKRVIEPDFLANLAYSQRISRDNETSMDAGDAEEVGEISMNPGETWWNNVINQRNMPPLYRCPLEKPTRSEYSSATSGFRSGTPEIFSDALDVSRSVTPLSVVSDEKSFSDDLTHLSHPREGSKSDSKILPRRNNKAFGEVEPRATRSASTKTMVLGQMPKEERSSLPMKRKLEKKRKSSGETTSHASDCFSTCVKCSRIISRTKEY